MARSCRRTARSCRRMARRSRGRRRAGRGWTAPGKRAGRGRRRTCRKGPRTGRGEPGRRREGPRGTCPRQGRRRRRWRREGPPRSCRVTTMTRRRTLPREWWTQVTWTQTEEIPRETNRNPTHQDARPGTILPVLTVVRATRRSEWTGARRNLATEEAMLHQRARVTCSWVTCSRTGAPG